MPYPTVPSRRFSTDTCSPKIKDATLQKCAAYYGQSVSAQWLLLTGYRHMQMLYLMPMSPFFFPPKSGKPIKLTPIHICWLSDHCVRSAFPIDSWVFVIFSVFQCFVTQWLWIEQCSSTIVR